MPVGNGSAAPVDAYAKRSGSGPAGWAFGVPGLVSMAAGGVILILIVVASVVLAVRNAETRAALAHAQHVQAGLFRLLQSMQDAETAQRGFLLTGKESYLEPYHRALGQLPGEVEVLDKQFPEQRASVERLTQAVRAKVDELRQTVDLARGGDRAGALAVVQTDGGKALMDAIRSETAVLLDRETGRLALLDRRGTRDGALLLAVDAAGAAMVLGLAGALVWGVRRNIHALTLARAALRASNAQLASANAALTGDNQALENRVMERTADLVAANEEIQRFAYIVSHDLRAPLVNIMGFTGELEAAAAVLSAWVERQEAVPAEVSTAANDDLPEAIRFIRASTGKMDRLIGAILRLSREGRRSFAPDTLDMAALLGGIADTMRFQAGEQGTEIVLEAVPDLVADKVAVEQVFSNVIENALKYRQPGRAGRVVVRGARQGKNAVFEIADNGRGIAQRDRERVFELFRRAGDQSVPGEGIGLAHVRALVRRMGGAIDFESGLGQGTVFRIILPLSPKPATAESMDKAA